MLAPAAFHLLRRVAGRTVVRRAGLICVLGIAERLLAVATAWALFESPLETKLVAGGCLTATFVIRNFLQRAMVARTEADLSARVVAAILEGDPMAGAAVTEDAKAELVQAVYQTSVQLSQDVPVLFADALAAAALSVAVAIVEPGRLILVVAGLAAGAGFILAVSRNRTRHATVGAWKLRERVVEQMVDAFDGQQEIVAAGRREAFGRETRELASAWGHASARIAAESLLAGRIPLLVVAAGAGVIAVLGPRALSGFAGVADLALLASVTPAFVGLGQGLQAFALSERWVRLVAEIIDGARPRPTGRELPPELPSSISVDGVSFRYRGATSDALSDLHLTWDGKGVLALTGANGSGKSTLLRLLLALSTPTSGHLRVGGADVSTFDPDAWRRRLAFLPQRPYLPRRSDVRAAIRLLAPEASDERMLDALRKVGLLGALERSGTAPLAVGVDTLSVGQKQRVGLARLLCRDAALYVLDEPDANLDREGIATVARLVRELADGHMVALAAHTPELLAIADQVVVLVAGSRE